ncbi:hypothetical protein HBH56_133530 [Parastagonospora nodorum]|uniref:Protein kinase domain-containing protein n=1 Tax=Phaeosphaeria nodorum (strain SN15 / ATCC MYA-4574 / FGSC 10173) TaxID=321614 RepID=A0A7U2FEH5_PHANO|nr:hypothetical protein HBH56_133530 [Parastagonospora nodorum]QRD02739.1 hypothetical protein JI435_307680 [Parastagonospora nodorum SN15]KAH3927169.1 hypothetical protein HBH54_159760 [Parastagonospora nodorum]KAH3949257.1 hypothetical protein HBH53_088610 [Parastagonospora nodorum]KAH4105215.1 hypothetical protein HBH46_088300 [Parastagonospora nodorum]
MVITNSLHDLSPPGICADSFQISDRGEVGFLGIAVRFRHGSCWKLNRAVSEVKYQHGEPPYEARQVFEAVCVEDPKGLHNNAQEAMVKVKYQVKATTESLAVIDEHQSYYCEQLSEDDTAETHQCMHDSIQYFEALRCIATNPVEKPHEYTLNEVQALRKLGDKQCTHTPHLLGVVGDWLPSGLDEQGMENGFVVFILMTKVSGEPLTYEKMQSKTCKERDIVRAALKKAAMALLKLGFSLHDRGMRNIMWDEENKKCCIVDFENYVDVKKNVEEWWDDDNDYRRWELDEPRYIARGRVRGRR